MPLYVVTFKPTPGGANPPEVRLRLLLKAALRGYGLRCVRVIEREEDEHADAERVRHGIPPHKPTEHHLFILLEPT